MCDGFEGKANCAAQQFLYGFGGLVFRQIVGARRAARAHHKAAIAAIFPTQKIGF